MDKSNGITKVQNFYFKERLLEFYEMSNILLKILTNQNTNLNLDQVKEPVLVARNISPLELVSLRNQLKGLVLEDGSVGSHTTIVCRALNIPLLIQTKDIINKSSNGDLVILDADQGIVHLRPENSILQLYISKIELRTKAKKSFLALVIIICVKFLIRIKNYCLMKSLNIYKKLKHQIYKIIIPQEIHYFLK